MKNHSIFVFAVTIICTLFSSRCTSSSASISKAASQKEDIIESSPTAVPAATVKPTKAPIATAKPTEETVPTCNGLQIKHNCELQGVMYSTYIYHPAVAAKTHVETQTTTEQVVSGYCTLCNDGTYSPTCATGRGACSHHGGVAQFNAPVYSNQTSASEYTVVDSPAVDDYYETVEK